MQAVRIYWGFERGGRFRLNWPAVRRASYVVVTASEGREGPDFVSTASPQRFIGAARFTVHSIAPMDGAVEFSVSIDWREPLALWTDVILFEPWDLRYTQTIYSL